MGIYLKGMGVAWREWGRCQGATVSDIKHCKGLRAGKNRLKDPQYGSDLGVHLNLHVPKIATIA